MAHQHTVTYFAGQAPTCTVPGIVPYYYCTDDSCETYGKVYADENLTTEIADLEIPRLHTLCELFNDVADAIRAKIGGSEAIVADTFPTAIAGIANLRTETGTWIPASSDVHTAVLPCSVDPKIVIATTADETPGAKNKILSFCSENISGALRNTVMNVLTPQGTLGGSTTAADFSQGYEIYTTFDFALTGYAWTAYYWDA